MSSHADSRHTAPTFTQINPIHTTKPSKFRATLTFAINPEYSIFVITECRKKYWTSSCARVKSNCLFLRDLCYNRVSQHLLDIIVFTCNLPTFLLTHEQHRFCSRANKIESESESELSPERYWAPIGTEIWSPTSCSHKGGWAYVLKKFIKLSSSHCHCVSLTNVQSLMLRFFQTLLIASLQWVTGLPTLLPHCFR